MTTYHKYLMNGEVELFTVVCLPEEDGRFPTVIFRSPYVEDEEKKTEDELCEKKAADFAGWIERGYAVVFQHCRGAGKSSSDFIPHIYDRDDGLHLHAWIREQSFYNGELYLCGASYTAGVHFVTAPFESDIKGGVFEVTDSEQYNCSYRNGLFKVGLNGRWYANMYKERSILNRSYTDDSYRMLPLSDFSKAVFGEPAENFDEIIKHPNKNDDFWNVAAGISESHNALSHANIPILLITGFYDIYVGGNFGMWRNMDEQTRSKSALVVHPFDHSPEVGGQPIEFENGYLKYEFEHYSMLWVDWIDSIRSAKKPPFERGRVTYYKLFENRWCCDDFYNSNATYRFVLGEGSATYKYNPYAPATFKGGLSTTFGGTAWQDEPNSRYDIVSLYSPEFAEDTLVNGRITAKLRVSSDCEDTCFYMRLSLSKGEGDFGLRDDINQISNFDGEYKPNSDLDMTFSFDEHVFLVKKGERIRVDISSSAWPHYLPHTNQRGLFSAQTTARIATNTVILEESYVEFPIVKR